MLTRFFFPILLGMFGMALCFAQEKNPPLTETPIPAPKLEYAQPRTKTLNEKFVATQKKTIEEALARGKEVQWLQGLGKLPKESQEDYVKCFLEAARFFNGKRIFEALEQLEAAEKIFDKNPGLYNLRGSCYVEMRDFPKALENFQKALKMSPSNVTLLFNLAETYYVSGQYEQAIKAFAKAKEGFANSEMKWLINLCDFKKLLCYLKLNKIAEAREVAKAHDIQEDSPFYYNAEAALAFFEKRPIDAQKSLLSATRIYRNSGEVSMYQDALIEAGYINSVYSPAIPEEALAPRPR